CQITAITNLEASFKQNRPKALIQMATGSGKTFTAITAIYRLLKYANAKRVLFLVDTKYWKYSKGPLPDNEADLIELGHRIRSIFPFYGRETGINNNFIDEGVNNWT
ncbi:MAG: DEAD/DEAH box helicase family protein, partial [Methylococcales bacterium]